MKKIIRLLTAFILILCFLFSLVGCDKNIELPHVESNLNCNFSTSFYPCAYINEDGLHYSRSGFLGGVYYNLNEKGRQKIISDYQLDRQIYHKICEEESYSVYDYVKYYEGYYYFFVSKFNDGGVDFYRYSKSDENLEKLFSPNKPIDNWIMYDGKVIYTTTKGIEESLSYYYLWYYDLDSTEPVQVGTASAFCFGIFDGKLRFLSDNYVGDNCALYEFDFSNNKPNLIKTFNIGNKASNIYNFTSNSVVFANGNELKILNIESDESTVYSLPSKIDSLSSFENSAFAYLEDGIYSINLTNVETKKIFDDFDEFGTVNAVNDEYALVTCYDGEMFTKEKIYLINTNGEVKKLV